MFETFDENDIIEETNNYNNNNPFISYNIYDCPMNNNNYQNWINSLYDEENMENNNPATPEKADTKIQNLEEKSTNIWTFQQPKFYSFEEIKERLSKIWANDQIEAILKDGQCLKNSAEYRFMDTLNKKRKRVEENDYIINSFDELQKKEGEKKRGRAPKKDSNKTHTKMNSDNIILKIKAKLFENILEFINALLSNIELNKKLNIELIKLDYNYIKNLRRDNELNLLNTTLKDILSMNISPKFKSKDKDYNKKTINDLIDNIDKKKNTLLFVLNMTFRDWLDIFTGKNNLENKANNIEGNQMDIDFKLIKNSFVGIDKFLSNLEEEIKKEKENDYKYFAFCIFYLYNYERWFFVKSSRKKKDKKKEAK